MLMVTLKDIARECKVSFSTVSKALQNSPEIGLETKEFVQKKAREMGYHPNLAARTLRTNKTYDIAVIFEEKTGVGLQHEYFTSVLSGIQKIAFQNGYDMTFLGGDSSKNYDYYSHVLARHYDGVAILYCDFTSESVKKLVKSDIPTITLDYCYDGEEFNDSLNAAVLSDSAIGMEELTEYVISLGHKNIAMIHGEKTMVTLQRIESFVKTCKKHGIELPDEYLIQGRYHDPDSSVTETKKIFELPNQPTCIIYPDDYAALGGIRELNNMNLIQGKDISVVGYDGIKLASVMNPPLTTYEQNGNLIGQTIARLLMEMFSKKNQVKYENEFVRGRLIPGKTVVNLTENK